MPSNIYTVGLRNAGSFQVAGQPYMSGSTTQPTLGSSVNGGHFVFPYVTKKIKITNEDADHPMVISFAPFLQSEAAGFGYANSASGSGNWLYLQATGSLELNVKCKEIFLAPATSNAVDCSIFAELTNIPTGRMYSLDGLQGVTAATSSALEAPNTIYSAGLQNVGSYLVSGRPYLTGSSISNDYNSIATGRELKVEFPRVTKSISLWNHCEGANDKLRLTFVTTASMTNYSTAGNYIELARDETITLDAKCKEVYLQAVGGQIRWKLYASLTEIPKERMYALTGSGISE